jgi:hypothetical protein
MRHLVHDAPPLRRYRSACWSFFLLAEGVAACRECRGYLNRPSGHSRAKNRALTRCPMWSGLFLFLAKSSGCLSAARFPRRTSDKRKSASSVGRADQAAELGASRAQRLCDEAKPGQILMERELLFCCERGVRPESYRIMINTRFYLPS